MRTTLTIDDDAFDAAKRLADREGRSVGEVVSDLVRRSLTVTETAFPTRNGIPQLLSRKPGQVVTSEMVAQLLEELEEEEDFGRSS